MVLLLAALAHAACPDGTPPDPVTKRCSPEAGTRDVSPFGYALRFVSARAATVGSAELEAGHETDEPLAVVQRARGWWIGETEVTQGQWAEVLARDPEPDPLLPATPWYPSWNQANLEGAQHPVQGVTWCDALRFANAASRVARRQHAYANTDRCDEGKPVVFLPPSDRPGFRLPTEVEWELAARAAGAYPWGTSPGASDLCTTENLRDGSAATVLGWEADVPCTDGFAGSAPAGSLGTAHPLGLADLLGNVREWTFDPYGDWPPGRTEDDPLPSGKGALRTARGGSWRTSARWARIANRQRALRSHRSDDLGLRLARDDGR